jgi:uncharacterized UPF0160 family protein
MDRETQKRSVATHNGSFHADEVTACALLLLFDLVDRDKIVRSRDMTEILRCEYVCDVGGVYDPVQKLFDHHQACYCGTFSSAGMVLAYLKQIELLAPRAYDYFNEALILGVDAVDNGTESPRYGICNYSQVVSNFSPIPYDADKISQDEAFFQALDFALGHLQRLWQRYCYVLSCKEIVAAIMAQSDDYLLFDRGMPWLEPFFELGGESHPAKFIIMPSGGHWKLRGIPPNYSRRMEVRCPLPEQWAGLLEEDLKKVTGIPGAIFCHKGRFISVWQTKEDALAALDMVRRK